MFAMFNQSMILFLLLSAIPLSAATFEDGDKVIFIGNTVLERAQNDGHLETTLTLAAGKKDLTFRNLAWSGDTVYGDARSYFGPPQEGFDRLKADLAEMKPNVVILCYGAVAAFEGDPGLAGFIQGYERLIDMIAATAKPRMIVLVSPPPAETLAAPMPDMTAHNKNLATYSRAIGELAAKKQLVFADFFTAVGTVPPGATVNGLHFTSEGYLMVSPKFVKAMGLVPPPEDKLKSPQVDQMRQAIIVKDKLFFHRWRPANETYLRLFRKHEQGQNAKELPMFDPLISEQEKTIEAMKQKILSLK